MLKTGLRTLSVAGAAVLLGLATMHPAEVVRGFFAIFGGGVELTVAVLSLALSSAPF